MIKFTPILLAIVYALVMYRFSAWRTKSEIRSKSTELADAKLKHLTDRMAAALELPRIRVNVYEIVPLNAVATADFQVFITRGFYEKYLKGELTAEEFTTIIAHELGHVALDHARRRMVDFSGQNALRTALSTLFSRFLPGIGAMIANGLAALVASRVSSESEYEADAYASALLMKAGIGTGPQKTLFAKLDALTKSNSGAVPAWLMSHPKTLERIAAIEKNERRWSTSGALTE